jgi:hypothetical protein
MALIRVLSVKDRQPIGTTELSDDGEPHAAELKGDIDGNGPEGSRRAER